VNRRGRRQLEGADHWILDGDVRAGKRGAHVAGDSSGGDGHPPAPNGCCGQGNSSHRARLVYQLQARASGEGRPQEADRGEKLLHRHSGGPEATDQLPLRVKTIRAASPEFLRLYARTTKNPYESLGKSHADSTAVPACPVSRYLPCCSRDIRKTPVLGTS